MPRRVLRQCLLLALYLWESVSHCFLHRSSRDILSERLWNAGACGVGVPDGVVCPQADPLGDGTVLLLSLCKLLLGAERLLGLYKSLENVERGAGRRGRAGAYRHRG